MVLVHADRDMRIHLCQGIDQVFEHNVVGVAARAPAGLDDHRRIDSIGRLQDRQTLFHIVDIESWHAIALLGGVIQELS